MFSSSRCVYVIVCLFVFFFKQKTAYEMRISDWSSDVCSSDLQEDRVAKLRFPKPAPCGKTPLMARGLSKSYGSLEIFTDVDLAIDRGSRVVILGQIGRASCRERVCQYV